MLLAIFLCVALAGAAYWYFFIFKRTIQPAKSGSVISLSQKPLRKVSGGEPSPTKIIKKVASKITDSSVDPDEQSKDEPPSDSIFLNTARPKDPPKKASSETKVTFNSSSVDPDEQSNDEPPSDSVFLNTAHPDVPSPAPVDEDTAVDASKEPVDVSSTGSTKNMVTAPIIEPTEEELPSKDVITAKPASEEGDELTAKNADLNSKDEETAKNAEPVIEFE